MKKRPPNLVEKFLVLSDWNDRFDEFFERMKVLRKKRLIDGKDWTDVVRAQNALQSAFDHAWEKLHRRAAIPVFPQEYLREDQVMEYFHISQKTLYRRRSKREIAYIKDREGTIWYPILDLVDYVRMNRSKPSREKPGRPRKF
jgi:hypothetical protein